MANGGLRRFWTALGPGLITGAADDDPSGIATYSQAGAQFGYRARPGRCSSRCRSWRRSRSSAPASAGRRARAWRATSRSGCRAACCLPLVALLVVANTINIAADLAAMGEALKLVVGGPAVALCAGLRRSSACVPEIFIPYHRYAGYLKFLTLVLFVYVAAAFSVTVPWGEVLHVDAVVPQFSLEPRHAADRRRGVRHDDQPVSVLLAGVAGGRGVAA